MCSSDLSIDVRLPAPVEVCVYRIVQEALHNVAQHSGASACTVSLQTTTHAVELTIEDNGRGMGAAGSPERRSGLGLIGMRERAQALGGTFAISDRPGGGTRISLRVPCTLQAVDGDVAVEPGARRA